MMARKKTNNIRTGLPILAPAPGLIIILVLFLFPQQAPGCVSCHQGIEEISPAHRFSCVTCHGGNENAGEKEAAHSGMLSNPSSLAHAGKKCGECHPEEVRRVQRSLMATAAGVVNQTRCLFGAQNKGEVIYAASFTSPLKPLPTPEESGVPADDLLRRKCLRCHLQNRGAVRYGDYRADGCAACHMIYSEDGLSRSGDRAVSTFMDQVASGKAELKRGYPVLHRMQTDIPTTQCTHCHNSNYVGADYVGRFERDYNRSSRFMSLDGESLRAIHGLDHHRLLPDVHFERGLACIDCHVQEELMGDGMVYGYGYRQLKVNCRDCHGAYERGPMETSVQDESVLRMARANPNYAVVAGEKVLETEKGAILAHVRRQDGFWVLTSKVTGRKHVIPQIQSKQIVNHTIPEHIDRMECYSCHAAWSFQDYGLNLMFDKSRRYEQWSPLWAQNDPQIQKLLLEELPLPETQRTDPVTRDWLTGEAKKGAWYSGWLYRRWGNNILGRNASGRVSVFRPQYQFIVTRVDERQRVLLNSEIPKRTDGAQGWSMNPYAPHSIRKETVRCEGCHGNAKAVGLGLVRFSTSKQGDKVVPLTRPWKDGLKVNHGLEQIAGINGETYQVSTHPGARAFNSSEISLLFRKSPRYIRYWLLEWQRNKGNSPDVPLQKSNEN